MKLDLLKAYAPPLAIAIGPAASSALATPSAYAQTAAETENAA